jgi:hypothetical protein
MRRIVVRSPTAIVTPSLSCWKVISIAPMLAHLQEPDRNIVGCKRAVLCVQPVRT